MIRLEFAPILAFALAPMLFAQCQCNPTGQPPYGGCYTWDYTTCSWVASNSCNTSPIVIDTDGTGFHLTSASDGVLFDFFGNGRPLQIAWTAKGSTNGWLALPKNGQITSARDLFGNITAQPLTSSHPPNGFAALAVYDTPAFGGNNNGVIDSGDAVWPNLRIWIDANHDGIAQPNELFTLEDIGIVQLSLRYLPSQYTDEYGNEFRYRGRLLPKRRDNVDRKIFDVILATQ